ncbi:unnamed protein product [Rotaria sordida]|uniref:Uncharacterized protein n=1 Tax=Rotaria sordida TaxID=392033 RepID=A0A814VZ13_9BILA|nr:unnamed protein product [Rotaria sordida]CAF1233332.1 unnamed protein product [Rotaria sordida]CAF3664111.1 unnamed protein product [Rotaria sordida]CAF3800727.1 unnamed protein product [Rotaria sordida]
MYGGNPNIMRELQSDMWIERNIPGGLNSSLGEYVDNVVGGNPNPTYGQIVGGYPGVGGYGSHGHGGHGHGSHGHGGHGFGGSSHGHRSNHSQYSHYGSSYGYSRY